LTFLRARSRGERIRRLRRLLVRIEQTEADTRTAQSDAIAEMEALLQSLLPDDLRKRLAVIVIDVSGQV
jgi:hypothetical protein